MAKPADNTLRESPFKPLGVAHGIHLVADRDLIAVANGQGRSLQATKGKDRQIMRCVYRYRACDLEFQVLADKLAVATRRTSNDVSVRNDQIVRDNESTA